MPSRYFCVLILGFWLATAGWWFGREVAPRLDHGEPPPFTIDLTDEARGQGLPNVWTIYRDDRPVGTADMDGKRVGHAHTGVRIRDDDTFEISGRFLYRMPAAGTEVHLELTSTYHVTRSGDLLALWATVKGDLRGPLHLPFQARIEGQVRKDLFHPEAWAEVGEVRRNLPLRPVAISGKGSVLNPLHPVNRIAGLQPGQRWRLPNLDPVAQALGSLEPGGGSTDMEWFDAEVLPMTQVLRWNDGMVPCLLIRYQGQETEACTWVRQEDSLVLRQEFSSGKGRLLLQRNPQ